MPYHTPLLPQPQWLFPPSALLRTPSSSLDSIPLADELNARAKSVHFAARLGMSLANASMHHTVGTAAMFLQRFYMRMSLRDYPPKDMAPVALFLAMKDCETAQRLKKIVSMVLAKLDKDANRQPDYPPINMEDRPEFKQWLKKILAYEEILINALCFDLIPSIPYQPFSLGLRRLESASVPIAKYRQMETVGWSFINDSLPTPLAILQPPEVIAAAAYVITKLVMDGVPVEDSLVSLDKWKGHFGMGEDMTRDREDVEQAMLWITRQASERGKYPIVASIRQNKVEKPFPQPSSSSSSSMSSSSSKRSSSSKPKNEDTKSSSDLASSSSQPLRPPPLPSSIPETDAKETPIKGSEDAGVREDAKEGEEEKEAIKKEVVKEHGAAGDRGKMDAD